MQPDKYYLTNIDRTIDEDGSVQLYLTWCDNSMHQTIQRVRLNGYDESNAFIDKLKEQYGSAHELPEPVELEFLAAKVNDLFD